MINRDELSSDLILKLLGELDYKLGQKGLKVKMNIYGGAVMCLVFEARHGTKDVDAIFSDTKNVYNESYKIATKYMISPDWLNDSIRIIKEKFKKEEMIKVNMYENINLYIPSAEQMFAMKAIAARDFPYKDQYDLAYLYRYLGIKNKKQAIKIIYKFFEKQLFDKQKEAFLERTIKRLEEGYFG